MYRVLGDVTNDRVVASRVMGALAGAEEVILLMTVKPCNSAYHLAKVMKSLGNTAQKPLQFVRYCFIMMAHLLKGGVLSSGGSRYGRADRSAVG